MYPKIHLKYGMCTLEDLCLDIWRYLTERLIYLTMYILEDYQKCQDIHLYYLCNQKYNFKKI